MDFIELAKNRYSCRRLTDRPVEEEKINKILEAAILSPTACNYQPYKLWVLKSEDSLEKYRQITSYHFGAGLVIAVGADPSKAWVRKSDRKNFGDVDAAIAATHLMLEAEQLGLGATWVGSVDTNKMNELFPDMKAYEMIGFFPIGYPSDDAKPSHLHTTRRELNIAAEFC